MNRTKSVTCTIIALLFSAITVFSQTPKNCNLAIRLISPVEDSIYDFGDTVAISLMIKNNGPDDITLSDTIRYYVFFSQSYAPLGNIASGDSVLFGPIGAIFNSDTLNDTTTVCVQLLNNSSTYTDPDSTNDENCVSFILKGSGKTGVETVSRKIGNLLHFYPNPATSEIIIPLKNARPENLSILISDIPGRILFQQHYKNISAQKAVRIDVSKFSPGLYRVALIEDGKKYAGKLLIQ